MELKPDLWRPTGFLQYFDTVGLVIWPVKIVTEMTYNVLSGTLNRTHSTVNICLFLQVSSLCVCVSSGNMWRTWRVSSQTRSTAQSSPDPHRRPLVRSQVKHCVFQQAAAVDIYHSRWTVDILSTVACWCCQWYWCWLRSPTVSTQVSLNIVWDITVVKSLNVTERSRTDMLLVYVWRRSGIIQIIVVHRADCSRWSVC